MHCDLTTRSVQHTVESQGRQGRFSLRTCNWEGENQSEGSETSEGEEADTLRNPPLCGLSQWQLRGFSER